MSRKGTFLGVSPEGTFSGFERSFFRAAAAQGWELNRLEVKLPLFRFYCTLMSFYPHKATWGLRRDRMYNTTITARERKSKLVQSQVEKFFDEVDLVYQIGALWTPVPAGFNKPFIISVSYTPKLSDLKSEWRREDPRVAAYWDRETRILFERATKICAITRNAANSVINDYGIDKDKVTVIGPIPSAQHFDGSLERTPDYASKRILFVGKGFKGKGLDTLLAAFKKVRLAVPDAILTVVGPSQRISGDGVEYLGRISDGQRVKDIFYSSAVFAMPSINEPVGQVFLEAMSCQLACIGTTVDAMPELIDAGQTGYTIEPGNADELTRNLITLVSDPDLCRKMGAAAYEKLRAQFSYEVVGRKIAEVMASVVPRA